VNLPDPLVFEDGRRVTTKDQWRERRKELLALFASQVYGRSPGLPDSLDVEVLEERIRVTCRRGGRSSSFGIQRFAPPRAGRPAPCFLFLNNRERQESEPSEFCPVDEVLARGYAIAVVQTSELAPDDPASYREGLLSLFPELEGPDACKMIGAWAWGASRALDALAQDPLVDAARVAVIGHSRGGKTALWASAQDERFFLAVSNESGNSGAAISRRPVGESIERINARFPHWFCDNYRSFDHREDALPVDQHELIALLAPRAVAIGSAADNEWADPEGEYLGLAHSSPVYALYGLPPLDEAAWPKQGEALIVPPRGYHLREGKHDLTLVDWMRYLDVADRVC
jgi:hypothetical protein